MGGYYDLNHGVTNAIERYTFSTNTWITPVRSASFSLPITCVTSQLVDTHDHYCRLLL
jgi:hypothetical protein